MVYDGNPESLPRPGSPGGSEAVAQAWQESKSSFAEDLGLRSITFLTHADTPLWVLFEAWASAPTLTQSLAALNPNCPPEVLELLPSTNDKIRSATTLNEVHQATGVHPEVLVRFLADLEPFGLEPASAVGKSAVHREARVRFFPLRFRGLSSSATKGSMSLLQAEAYSLKGLLKHPECPAWVYTAYLHSNTEQVLGHCPLSLLEDWIEQVGSLQFDNYYLQNLVGCYYAKRGTNSETLARLARQGHESAAANPHFPASDLEQALQRPASREWAVRNPQLNEDLLDAHIASEAWNMLARPLSFATLDKIRQAHPNLRRILRHPSLTAKQFRETCERIRNPQIQAFCKALDKIDARIARESRQEGQIQNFREHYGGSEPSQSIWNTIAGAALSAAASRIKPTLGLLGNASSHPVANFAGDLAVADSVEALIGSTEV